jgi:hypothetical protein
MPDICFDAQRHVVLRISETEKHTIFVSVMKDRGTRKVDVQQLITTKFNSTYNHETTSTSVHDLIEKWQNLVNLGVVITPAARHVFADITNPKPTEEEPVARPTPTTKQAAKKDMKKPAPAPTKKATEKETKKPAPSVTKKSTEKETKKPTVQLTRRPRAEATKEQEPDEGLPFATAMVCSAPSKSNLKVGKSLEGGEPTHPTIVKGEVMEPTKKSTTKPTVKDTKKVATKTAPPAKTETKAALKTPLPFQKKAETKTAPAKGGDIVNKKIKANPKADLSITREGTVRRKLFEIVMKCTTVAEALKKTVKRASDGEPINVPLSYVKEAAELGFITLS